MCKLYPDLRTALTKNAASVIESTSFIEGTFIKVAAFGLDRRPKTNNKDLSQYVKDGLCVFGYHLTSLSPNIGISYSFF